MSFQYEVEVADLQINVAVSGTYSPSNMFELIDAVKAECDLRKVDRVMVDCSNILGDITEADRFAGGKRVADVFGPDVFVALVMPPGAVTKLGQIAAANRGAMLFVSDSKDEAIDWLLTS